MRRIVSGFALLLLLLVLMGHDHGGCGEQAGVPTGAECDPRLRWDGFGRDFMERYCVRCHASTLSGTGERRGAPADHDYDTREGVQRDPSHIDLAAGAGPAGENTFMPPYGPLPTREEREQLARWLACGAP